MIIKNNSHFVLCFLFLILTLNVCGQEKTSHFSQQLVYHIYENYTDEPPQELIVLNNNQNEYLALIDDKVNNDPYNAFYIKGDSLGMVKVDMKTREVRVSNEGIIDLSDLSQNASDLQNETRVKDINQTEVVDGLTCNLYEYKLAKSSNGLDGIKFCVHTDSSIENADLLEVFIKVLSKDSEINLNTKGLILKFGPIKTYETEYIVLKEIVDIPQEQNYTMFLKPNLEQNLLQDIDEVPSEAPEYETSESINNGMPIAADKP